MKTMVVLGMHRSATSLVAKGLHDAGVHMGDRLLGPTKGNDHGHFEDKSFIQINDRIIGQAGGSWRNPPPEKDIIEVGKQIATEIYAFIKTKERYPLWGWKDPRTTITIRCYVEHLTNPIFVSCFRSVHDVAESLKARDNMDLAEGVKLAKIYNERLMRFLNEWKT